MIDSDGDARLVIVADISVELHFDARHRLGQLQPALFDHLFDVLRPDLDLRDAAEVLACELSRDLILFVENDFCREEVERFLASVSYVVNEFDDPRLMSEQQNRTDIW